LQPTNIAGCMSFEHRDLDQEASLHETKRASRPTLKINMMMVMVLTMVMMMKIITIKFLILHIG
jgi:hypothetical protein